MEGQVRKIVSDCALPQEWADDWYKWMEKDEKKELILSDENIKRLKDEVKSLDKKLNILLDSYLDQAIDAETYKPKRTNFSMKN
ncbi:hypothetical protein HYW46_02635 [Candidatus Daviesbacteria bacterium]|nr:hypothetical protein [Candidatus Daviesbacteria bacterium]